MQPGRGTWLTARWHVTALIRLFFVTLATKQLSYALTYGRVFIWKRWKGGITWDIRPVPSRRQGCFNDVWMAEREREKVDWWLRRGSRWALRRKETNGACKWEEVGRFAVCGLFVVARVVFTWAISSHRSMFNLLTHIYSACGYSLSHNTCSHPPSHKAPISYPLSQTMTI